ncbi:thioredoxin-disulfide reductase [Candidatus Dependentiae bacterium]
MNTNNIEKLVIIGSGPAGLTAGIYASRAELNPLIIEGSEPGGQLMGTSYVQNWPGEKNILGAELMKNMREHAKHFGSRFLPEKVVNLEVSQKPFTITTDKDNKIKTHTIILATGAAPKKLGCEGEDTYWGKGVTTCAVCDGAFYKDKKVIILGGGDTAMEDASFMQKFTKDITVIHIGDKFTASVPMQKRVIDNPDTKIIYNSTIAKFIGNGEHLQQIEIENQETKEKMIIQADGVFIAIGQSPNTGFLKGKVELSDYGYVVIKGHKEHTKTSIEGVFAAGDVADPFYRQAITSSAMGCMAALDAERYLAKILD